MPACLDVKLSKTLSRYSYTLSQWLYSKLTRVSGLLKVLIFHQNGLMIFRNAMLLEPCAFGGTVFVGQKWSRGINFVGGPNYTAMEMGRGSQAHTLPWEWAGAARPTHCHGNGPGQPGPHTAMGMGRGSQGHTCGQLLGGQFSIHIITTALNNYVLWTAGLVGIIRPAASPTEPEY